MENVLPNLASSAPLSSDSSIQISGDIEQQFHVPLEPLSQGPLEIQRLSTHHLFHNEIKDPSVVQVADHLYMMFASVGNSIHQQWIVGRFRALSLQGPWEEIEPVKFKDLRGAQLCAPAVTYEADDKEAPWKMYIQDACFVPGSVIAYATSKDGRVFTGQPHPLATKDSVDARPNDVIGVYDAGISEIKSGKEELLCLLYSGYRKIGCGDLYVSTKNKRDLAAKWSRGSCLLQQEQVPFHNRPDSEYFEWGLEGAKIVQLSHDCFLLIGVSFLPQPNEFAGKRQRVFWAGARDLQGPYVPIGLPLYPSGLDRAGENGHSDTFIDGDYLWLIYQERLGASEPWGLRYAKYEIGIVEQMLREKLV